MDTTSGVGHVKSSWICITGLSSELTEGDIITVFSQFGEVININLLRHKQTGRSRGLCFLCYQDLASTILAVDNFNGITLLQRKLKVNYVNEYKLPKYLEDDDEDTKRLLKKGCAPKPVRLPLKRRKGPRKRKQSVIADDQHDRSVSISNDYHAKSILPKKNDIFKDVKFKPQPNSSIKADWRDVKL